ncbi:hypothetical protein CTEN210_06260 [Chaetoceros tenuissimus]|uniref:Uncharacterized protein n=1 Tax=Chaetoceros tenuissimus TaxID=426638 RepID=A0AAD3CSB2_9STRA|nr:hypothetical protein CTEN210_06260 [Chaetoceros tenuissimus]
MAIEWTSPEGEKFSFTFNLSSDYAASNVKQVDGKIHITTSIPSDGTLSSPSEESAPKKGKVEEEVGYAKGYIIKRNYPNFHRDGDAVSNELHEFTFELYDKRGNKCKIPGSELASIPPSKGDMFLLDIVEIDKKYKGMDLGINFVHELLKNVSKTVGVCVMNPTISTKTSCRYRPSWSDLNTGTDKRDTYEMNRTFTVKLRKQFYRMGFRPVKDDSPTLVNKWFLSLNDYKTKIDVKETWLSKEDVQDIEMALTPRVYIKSEKDEALLSLIESMAELDNLKKDQINRLISDGASLTGINALHIAVACRRNDDVISYLIVEHNMPIDGRDENDNTPLHVAVAMENVSATAELLTRGASKSAVNKDGQTPMQVLKDQEKRLRAFGNMMGIGMSNISSESERIKLLLRM